MTRLRRRSFGLAAFAAVLAIALSSSTASATFPGTNGRIAFLSTDIHTIRPDGNGDQLLVKGFGPSWSADGNHIVFARFVGSQPAIFTMRADGSNQRRVTHSPFNEGAPSFSPNRRRIVFLRTTSRLNRVAVISSRLNGSHQRVLAHGYVGGTRPEYSPNGKRILYGNDAGLWDMRPNGSHKRQLTRTLAVYPDYSPDGKHIIFEYNGHPHVMRSDGSHLHRLDCRTAVYEPQYSPSGRKLVWVGGIGHGRGASSDIFTSTRRCTDPVRLTYYGASGGGGAVEPTWQPLPSG